jgi:hypothetical protein
MHRAQWRTKQRYRVNHLAAMSLVSPGQTEKLLKQKTDSVYMNNIFSVNAHGKSAYK